MGEIFSVSRQKTQESPLTSTNMLKQLEVEESGETLRPTAQTSPDNKKWMPGEHTHQASTRKKSVIHLRNGDPNVPLDAA